MAARKTAVLLALLACTSASLASAASGRHLLQAIECPVNPAEVELDFSNVAQSCGTTTICTTCVCSLVTVFTPALKAGGITFDPAAPTSFPLDSAAGIIRACSEQYLVSMITAGVNVSTLAGLTNCSFASATDVPPCLVTAVGGLAANTTTTATNQTTTGAVNTTGATTTTTISTADADDKITGTNATVTATSRTDTAAPASSNTAATPAAAPSPAAKTSGATSASTLLSTVAATVLLAATLMA